MTYVNPLLIFPSIFTIRCRQEGRRDMAGAYYFLVLESLQELEENMPFLLNALCMQRNSGEQMAEIIVVCPLK